MAIGYSKVTAQGQISVPAEVRKKLGVGPGSVLEWHERDDEVLVRRAGRRTSLEIHKAAFPDGVPPLRKPADLKEGIRRYIRRKYARR
jgi:AbrB family looped-hinge helix DNA binding protein